MKTFFLSFFHTSFPVQHSVTSSYCICDTSPWMTSICDLWKPILMLFGVCGNRVCYVQIRLRCLLALWLHSDFTVFIFIKVNKHVHIVLGIFSVVLQRVSCQLMIHNGSLWNLCVLALQLKDAFLISSFTRVCQKCRLIKVWGATQGLLYKQNAIFLFSHRLLWSVKKSVRHCYRVSHQQQQTNLILPECLPSNAPHKCI